MVNPSSQFNGFSLVELMITLAIVAILATLAAPSFRTTIQDNRQATQINDLQASLSVARNTAISRNNNTTICSSNDGASCGGNWENGWISFLDINANGAVDGEDDIVRVHGPITQGSTLRYNSEAITYANNGIARAGSGQTFRLCDDRGAAHAKGLIIAPSGRATPALPLGCP